MARRRNRNRKRAIQHLRSQSISQYVLDEDRQSEHKRFGKEELQRLSAVRDDLLSRSVIVGSVKPLASEINRIKLQSFLTGHYGSVEKITLVWNKRRSKHNQFPRGRVLLNHRQSAEKIFGGKSLLQARKESSQMKVVCPPVGHRGAISIQPAPDYKDLMKDEMEDGSSITINSSGMALGYWFSSQVDSCLGLPGASLDDLPMAGNTWVLSDRTGVRPIINVDVRRAVVELEVARDIDTWTTGIDSRTVMSFRFKDLVSPIKLFLEKKSDCTASYCLVFSLKHPPRLTTVSTNMMTDWESSCRLTRVEGIQNVGECLGYNLAVSKAELDRLMSKKSTFQKLKKFGLFDDELSIDTLREAETIQAEPLDAGRRAEFDAQVANVPMVRTRLVLLSLVTNNMCTWFDLLNDNIDGKSLFRLIKNGQEDLVARALDAMNTFGISTRHPARMFHALYNDALEGQDDTVPERHIPSLFCVVPRLLLTPTRLVVTGSQVEMSNRIIRKFIQDHNFMSESFIRLTLGDENSDKLYPDDMSVQVEERIKELVLEGIKIAGKHYKFLAYSSSQLKEQSLWLVSPERGWTVDKMRTSLGDFSMCKTPSKYAARIGQCFSTTVSVAEGSVSRSSLSSLPGRYKKATDQLRVKDDLEDITSRWNGLEMQHSDGVGLIRKEVLQDVIKQVPFGPRDKRHISAIQIRFGGAKGVLAGWSFEQLKHLKNGLESFDVCLRPSQVKFQASYTSLEVVNLATRIPYFLNRNVVLLGSHLGIQDDIFLHLQEEMIQNLNAMLYDADRALNFLPSLAGPDGSLVSTLMSMLLAGMKPDIDPFLFSCLHTIRAHHMMTLRKKARIFVRDGAVLMGCLDETRLVPENSVFVQVKHTNGSYKPIEGKVMVTKHPVMHPGDIRMLEAVAKPELQNMKDVIVFSQHGRRPEADKMSGSDLDGDLFAVTWDERLFLRKSSDPMDYSPSPTIGLETPPINNMSLLEHFIVHAKNDNLGRISMLWLDHAVTKGGAGCHECLQLAKLASIAVDFPKSGTPATLPDNLKMKSAVPRAHWRELKNNTSFHCKSILGRLYDMVVSEMKHGDTDCVALAGRKQDGKGLILRTGKPRDLRAAKETVYDCNPKLPSHLGWKRNEGNQEMNDLMLEFALAQRFAYEEKLEALMNKFKVNTEGEIATGLILKHHKLNKRRRHNVSEEIRSLFRALRRTFRIEFFTAVHHIAHCGAEYFEDINSIGDGREELTDEELESIEDLVTAAEGTTNCKVKCVARLLASSYYLVTYSPYIHNEDDKIAYFSFPWVISDVIACGLKKVSK